MEPTLLRAARDDVAADGLDAGEHVPQVAGDGDFLHRIRDLAVLDPVTGGTARIVASDVIDAVAEQLGDQQPAAHLLQQALEVGASGLGVTIRLWLPPALPVVCMPSLRAE